MSSDSIQEGSSRLGRSGRLHARPGLGVAQRLWQWRENRKAIHKLSMLDDRMLRDMGISRSEIVPAVRGDAFDMARK